MSANLEIVGFDLGHGESALAHTTLVSANEPEALTIHNRPTVLSVVGVDAAGTVAIGENALRQSERMAELFLRFKSLPPADGVWPGERALRLFVRGIVRELADSRQLPRPGDARVFVGIPSGWTAVAEIARRLETYRTALQAAGLAHVEFVPESRAAFMHARESGELQLGLDQLSGRVLVVDLGSSTADCTLVKDLNPLPLDFGDVALGAALIEQTLLRHALQRHEAARRLAAFYQRHPARHAFDELCWRTLKEEFFNAEAAGTPEPRARNIFAFELDDGEEVLLRAMVDRDAMRAALAEKQPVLAGRGWRETLRACLVGARDAIGGDPDLVLFTGGASRMGFVTEDAQAIFPTSRVVRGKAPELAIAKGLAWWGRTRLRAAAFTAEVEALCAKPADVPDSAAPDAAAPDNATPSAIGAVVRAELPALLDALAPVLAAGIAEQVVIPWGRAWREGRVATLRAFETATQTQAAAWIDSTTGHAAVAAAAQLWLRRLTHALEELTDPICDRYRIPRRALGIDPATHVSGQLLAGQATGGLDFTHVQGLATVVNLVTAAVVGTLVGGSGKALLLAGPAGWVVGFVGAALLLFAGQQAAREAVKDWTLPGTGPSRGDLRGAADPQGARGGARPRRPPAHGPGRTRVGGFGRGHRGADPRGAADPGGRRAGDAELSATHNRTPLIPGPIGRTPERPAHRVESQQIPHGGEATERRVSGRHIAAGHTPNLLSASV